MTNRLARETSPYLQQHAGNPVEWFPWGEEALRLAREHDKPILLSVGYSACHWCHVMAHESFEDPEVAAVMNRLFVNIKVDREERPDLDQIYQTAHAVLTRRNGGWPLTMFLTPDQEPFFGGTYFPKAPRYGMPGFVDVLQRVAQAWREQRAAIREQNAVLRGVLEQTQPGAPAEADPGDAPIEAGIAALLGAADADEGGFGGAPKFPHPAELAFCLYFGNRAPRLAAHALFTLEKMALGGLFDQLGGGFARYSVDGQWGIPHFEKMLYDNGPLLALYADAWALTGNALFERVVVQTADWVMREMQSPEGGYYSSLDADSEHVEGKFYVWSRDEVRALLGDDEYAVTAPHYGLDGPPNFENEHWHLRIAAPLPEVAEGLGISAVKAQALLERGRDKLFAARERRVRPGRDEKILTSWNALMIAGMARAARVFAREDWLASAQRAADFLFTRLGRDDRLLAAYKDGRAHLNAYLDDYAFAMLALLELLQARYRDDDLERLRQLAQTLLARFEDRAAGGFFFVSDDHERLILKPKPFHDQATPSGNGAATWALIRLGHLLGEPRYVEAAARALRLFAPLAAAQPAGAATLCLALAEWLRPTRVVILRGQAVDVARWQHALARWSLPDALVLGIPGDAGALPPVLDKPALPRGVNAHVCEGVTCLPAVTRIEDLRELLFGERS